MPEPECDWQPCTPEVASRLAAPDALIHRDPFATPFHDPRLIAAFQQVFRPQERLRIATVRDTAGQATAQFALVERRTRLGPVPMRQLEAGPRNQASLTGMLVDPASPDAAVQLLTALQQQPGWDLLECRAVPADSALARAAQAVGAAVRTDVPAAAIPASDTPTMLSGDRRRRLGRLQRRMQENEGTTLALVRPEDPGWRDALAGLTHWHTERWRDTPTPSPFGNTDVTRRFLERMSGPGAPPGAFASILRNERDGEVRGVVLAFEGPHDVHAWRIGYDSALNPYSPGIQMVTQLVHETARRGYGFLELGRGADAYKQTWHAIERHRVTVRWHRPTSRCRLIAGAARLAGRRWTGWGA